MLYVNGPLGLVYTWDFFSLLRLFWDKMGIEPNWKTCCKTIARAQKPVKKSEVTPIMDENTFQIELYRKTQTLGVNRPLERE